MERKQPDGSWQEIAVEEVVKIGDVQVTLPTGGDDLVVDAEEPGQRAPRPAEETGNAQVSPEMPDLGALFVDTQSVQELPETHEPGDDFVPAPADGDMDFDVPGLTTTESKKSVSGQKSVLQKLQDRARGRVRVARPNGDTGGSKRPAVKLEVAERAAVATGPAVRDTTEARTRARSGGTKSTGGVNGVRSVGTKPAPGILSDQPAWVKDLFEAHFRGSRTAELRRKPSGSARADGTFPDRMKMSREDFAIGWLVMLEAARRDPEILRVTKGRKHLPAPEDQLASQV